MIRYLYSILITLVSPLFLYALYKKKKGKPSIGPRWKEHFGNSPPLCNQKQPIWIHAVSVGEVLAVTPFIKQLKMSSPHLNLLLTTTTSTGAEQASKLSEFCEHRYMPLDFSFAVKLFIKKIQPQQLIIMETELWPNTMHQCAKFNIPVTVINARLSERSFLRYQKVQWVFDLLAKNISQLLCQTQDDANRFKNLGVDTSKIKVTGSIKFDINVSPEIIEKGNIFKEQLGSHRPIWIAASTHQGEDEQIITAHKQLLKKNPTALLILVPRHPERFNEVFKLIQTHKLNAVKRTTKENTTAKTQVYLADTMGEMLLLIQSADICFMGGSLIGGKVGGHNLLEPAALSKPCLTGPSFFNFTLITQQLIDNNACTICHDSNEISEQLISLFFSSAEIKKQGKNALYVVNKNKGAIMKTLSYLKYGE